MNARDEHVQMVADCMQRESKLTDWECNFIDSLDRQLTDGTVLTTNQIEHLDRIWDEVT